MEKRRVELRTFHMRSEHSTTELHPHVYRYTNIKVSILLFRLYYSFTNKRSSRSHFLKTSPFRLLEPLFTSFRRVVNSKDSKIKKTALLQKKFSILKRLVKNAESLLVYLKEIVRHGLDALETVSIG